MVVERVTGRTLRDFTRERIFEPLGMEATHFHDDHEMIVPDRAWAYAPDPDGLHGLKMSIPDFDVVGATSLFTTAHDLAAWDRNFYTGQVGGTGALKRLRGRFVLSSGDTIGYAHGLGLGRYRGLATEEHGGADAGYRSHFLRFPEQRLSVAVLCNLPSANPGRRARAVATVFLGGLMEEQGGGQAAEIEAETVPLSDRERAALVGVYRGEVPNRVVRVLQSAGGLGLDLGRTFALRPLGAGRFEVEGRRTVVTLGPASGRVVLDAPGLGLEGLERVSDVWEPPPSVLKGFEGTYRSDELGTEYRIALEEGGLRIHHRKLGSRSLLPTFVDGFRIRGASAAFTRDGSGRVDGFGLSDGRVWSVRFDRVEGPGRTPSP